MLIISTVMMVAGCVPGNGVTVRATGGIDPADTDFIKEARLLFRIAACAGMEPVPERISTEIINQHCAELEPAMKKYAGEYVDSMKTLLAGYLSAKLLTTVIYPFGGGDLLSALTTYPDATEFYTLSLELAGDIRRMDVLDDEQAYTGLKSLRDMCENLISLRNSPTGTVNTNETLKATQRGNFPGLIALAFIALAIHGQEPVSLRYFELEENGNIHYLGADEIAARQGTLATPLLKEWTSPDFSAVFSNYELRFKPRGEAGPIRIHRHIAVNLANPYFDPDSPVYRHLKKKGSVAAMTKGALYLLWRDGFTNIRNYLIDQIDFMISDSTGLSPLHLPPSLFHYTAIGRFEGLFDVQDPFIPHNAALIEVFKHQPYRPLPYRYGYPDKANNPHMIFVQRRTSE
ncbi:MAG: hypothetical protein A2W28_00005 [Gammaproteobacteria bacterium RBG_16_51_14]|nr:MAG: hypothetical protein A2W28_00005 [Gammaproteobacteria bacterium RBG_16_51_14]